jgi:TRAP-type C4-dicarboxylate transport system permease small subunit
MPESAPQPGAPAGRLLDRVCWWAAATGGLAIVAVATLVTLSVTLRALTGSGIRGDFEAVQLGSAVSAFLFLPICQLKRRHVRVDLFSNWLPHPLCDGLERAWEIVFALAWLAIVWRLLDGAVERYGYGDRTMLLRWPLWTVYVPALFGTGLSILAALHIAWALPPSEGTNEPA